MNVHLILDEAGRVLIPKPLREEMHLETGDALEVESAGEQITLRPVREAGSLLQEQGVWMFYSGQPLAAAATDEMLQKIRDERDVMNSGNGE